MTDTPSLSALPTEARPLTQEGTIIGTFQYMAPEQLEGKDADARTDIFAFGAVLYEMLTGRKAFEGKSQASLISAIMSGEPAPMASLQPLAPPSLEHVVSQCLAKDPGKRWQAAADLARELESIGETSHAAARVFGAEAVARSLFAARFWAPFSRLSSSVISRRKRHPAASSGTPSSFRRDKN